MNNNTFSLSILAMVISASTIADEKMEHMIVTGSRVAENIDEVPSSVTLIEQASLEKQLNISSDIQNLLAIHVPGISAGTGTSSNFGQTLRGRAALVMIDGVPQSPPLRNGALGMKTLDPSVIERIEVIQGATSIYGNGAAGGIINYITKSPDTNSRFNLNADVSTRFSAVNLEDSVGKKVSATANGTLQDLSYVVGVSVEHNGVLRDAEGDALGTQYGLSEGKTNNYFSKLQYAFDGEKNIGFTYNYYASQQDTDWVDVLGNISEGEKTYAINDPDNRPPNAEPQGPRGNHNFQLKYADADIFTNTQMSVDLFKQSIENVFFYSTRLGNVDLGVEGGQSMIKSEKQGLRATFVSDIAFSKFDTTLVYGIDSLNDITSQPLIDGRMWVPEMDMGNLAGFVQSKWLLGDNLVLKAGLRKENIEITVNDYNTLKLCTSPTVCSEPMAVAGGTINFNATTYNLGLRYNAHKKFSPYISYSEGSDMPDLGSLLRSATVNDISLIQTEAGIIKNMEVGFISQHDKLRLELLAYQSKSDLGSKSVLNPNTGIYITQRAPQKIWGYEGVINYQITDNLDVNATYGYVEGKHTATDEYIGGRQISAPKATIVTTWQPTTHSQLAVTYLQVGDRDRFARDENGNYSGDEGAVKGYSVINISGSYNFDSWSVYAGVENLLNNDYFPARSQALTYSAYNVKGIGTTINMGVKISL